MMPNITRGGSMPGLIMYLRGQGKANEHTNPHVVAGHDAVVQVAGVGALGMDAALDVSNALDRPSKIYGTEVTLPVYDINDETGERITTGERRDAHVWHCSLSVKAEEGELSDAQWSAIATDFVREMGFVDDEGAAGCRWVAIRHGLSIAGNDHVHIAVNLVREDGTKADVHRDYVRAQKIAGELEVKYGLDVLESRQQNARTLSANKPAETARAVREGENYTQRDELRRRLRTVAANSPSERDFIAAARNARVIVRPRYEKGGTSRVVGYTAAMIPTKADEKPVWYAPSKLDRSLGLPQLRSGWEQTNASELAAVDAWKGAGRAARMRGFDAPDKVKAAPVSEVAAARVASHDTEAVTPGERVPAFNAEAAAADLSGVYAHASMAFERGTPGPLAAASDEFARVAQGQRGSAVPLRRALDVGYQARLMARGAGTDSKAGWIAVMRQMNRVAKRIATVQHERGAADHAVALRARAEAALRAVQERVHRASGQPATAAPGSTLGARPTTQQRPVNPGRTRDPDLGR
jgi:hypothetical protein